MSATPQREELSPKSSTKAAVPSETSQELGTRTEGGNVDKIREILFGGQMRDYDKRFVRLEERLIKESSDLREDVKRSFETLEAFVKKEFESLENRLQLEQQSREGSVERITSELQNSVRVLDGKLNQFDNQSTQAQRDLRQQLLDQSKSLSEEIRRKHEDVSGVLAKELAQVNHEKTDRASLASLFTELAMRLNNNFDLPGDN